MGEVLAENHTSADTQHQQFHSETDRRAQQLFFGTYAFLLWSLAQLAVELMARQLGPDLVSQGESPQAPGLDSTGL